MVLTVEFVSRFQFPESIRGGFKRHHSSRNTMRETGDGQRVTSARKTRHRANRPPPAPYPLVPVDQSKDRSANSVEMSMT